MGSAVLFILRSRLLVCSIESGVNRVKVVLSEVSVILLCFVQANTLCWHGCCMYLLVVLMIVCRYDDDAICIRHYMSRCSGWL